MKIIKRDGRVVDYNSSKIKIAIIKANNEVAETDKISDNDITQIINYIENLKNNKMRVEEIQDIIELKLMEYQKYKLAKKYIIYRYKRSIIRKYNTTDISIMSLIKNNGIGDNQYLTASEQRDLMIKQVSRDLAYRLLLPEKVVNADKNNEIKFYNIDRFTEPIIEDCYVNFKKIFKNGIIINDLKIEKAKSFQSACNIIVEVATILSQLQTGNIYIELKDLLPFYEVSYKKNTLIFSDDSTDSKYNDIAIKQTMKEIKSGIQTIFYQINTLCVSSETAPKIFFLIDSTVISNKWEERIISEFIHQKNKGIKNKNGNFTIPLYPKIIYSLTENLSQDFPYIIDNILNSKTEFIIMNEQRYKKFISQIQRFNQGSICINILKLAEDSACNIEQFLKKLTSTLEICYEGFLCRNHNLQGTYGEKSPIHWKYGIISNLNDNCKIDELLKNKSSYLTLRLCGLHQTYSLLNADDSLKNKIFKIIRGTVKSWNKANNFEVLISNYISHQNLENIYAYKNNRNKKTKIPLEIFRDNIFEKMDFQVYYITNKNSILEKVILNNNYIFIVNYK